MPLYIVERTNHKGRVERYMRTADSPQAAIKDSPIYGQNGKEIRLKVAEVSDFKEYAYLVDIPKPIVHIRETK